MVRSSSWPTPLTTGMREAKIACATGSSLKAHRSSRLPPPRPTIITSMTAAPVACSLLTRRMASAISCAAPSPCTLTGQTHTSAAGQRRDRISSMSRTAEPVGLVTSTTRRGMRGSFFLRAGSKKP